MTFDIIFGKTYIKGVGWCSGMKVGLHVSGRGFDRTKRVREREFVINI